MYNANQMTLDGFAAADAKESAFLAAIEHDLCAAIESSGGAPEMLKFRPTKPVDGYTSVLYGSLLIFRIKLRRGQHYISVPTLFKDIIPDNFPSKQLKSDPQFIRLLVGDEYPAEAYTTFLSKITGETINRYPKEWDCCSRYLECSDAKACVHPDKLFALGCGYRKILQSGKIYYGKNRNID